MIEAAGLQLVKVEDNPQYQFISDNAKGAARSSASRAFHCLREKPDRIAQKAMRDAAFAYELSVRLAAFGGVFAVLAIWEFVGPRRNRPSDAAGGGPTISACWR